MWFNPKAVLRVLFAVAPLRDSFGVCERGRRVSGDALRRILMQQRFEYEFVRLGEGWMNVKKSAKQQYQQVIREYAREV